MKIPKLFKKAAAFVMAAVTALSIMPATAFAAGDIGTIFFSHTYDSNGNAMRYNSSANIGGYTAGGTGNYKYRMFVDGENAFCIQPGVPLKTGNTLKKASSDTWNALSANQKKAVGLALLYGYQGNRNNLSGSDDEKWLATQTLVWEFVTGCREATGSYNQTSTTVYSLHFGSNYANSGARAVYDQIVAMLREHNTIPSFMSGGKNDITKELAYKDGKYSITLTDSNGVLSDYSFSSSDSNVSVSKSGNKLTISSTVAISGSVRITAKRNNVPTVSSSAKLIAYGDPNLQDLVTGVEKADTVSALVEQQERTVFSEAEDTLTARLQHQLLKLRNILKAQNQMLTQEKEQIKTLISDISHQIKTPVAAANTFAQLLGDTGLSDEERREYIATLQMSLEKLTFLTNSLIKMSRLESGIIRLKPEQSSLNDIVMQAVKTVYAKARDKNITITFDCGQTFEALLDFNWTAEAVTNVLDKELPKRLAQKGYNKAVVKKGEARLKQIKRITKNYSDDEIEKIYTSMNKARQLLVTPIEPTWDQLLTKWYEEEYQGKEFKEGTPLILTEKGERVRSKSEKILADYFYRKNILYKYEKPLHLKGYGTVYPDFTFLSKKTYQEIYWEHEGMMDKQDYTRAAVRKIELYQINHIYPGDRLIITFETEQNVLNSKIIENLIEKYLI